MMKTHKTNNWLYKKNAINVNATLKCCFLLPIILFFGMPSIFAQESEFEIFITSETIDINKEFDNTKVQNEINAENYLSSEILSKSDTKQETEILTHNNQDTIYIQNSIPINFSVIVYAQFVYKKNENIAVAPNYKKLSKPNNVELKQNKYKVNTFTRNPLSSNFPLDKKSIVNLISTTTTVTNVTEKQLKADGRLPHFVEINRRRFDLQKKIQRCSFIKKNTTYSIAIALTNRPPPLV